MNFAEICSLFLQISIALPFGIILKPMFHIVKFLDSGSHDDIIKWKHFLFYWPFVRGIPWSLVDSPHKYDCIKPWEHKSNGGYFCIPCQSLQGPSVEHREIENSNLLSKSPIFLSSSVFPIELSLIPTTSTLNSVWPSGAIWWQIQVNIGTGNGLLPDGNKLVPQPMLTSH